jgi:hypothetical protein
VRGRTGNGQHGHHGAAKVKILIEVIGWAGALLVLGAYGLLTTRRLASSSAGYQWLNAAGSAGLIVNSAWNGAFPVMFLNVVWLAVTAYAIVRRPAAS